jgi:hypothetical protein
MSLVTSEKELRFSDSKNLLKIADLTPGSKTPPLDGPL